MCRYHYHWYVTLSGDNLKKQIFETNLSSIIIDNLTSIHFINKTPELAYFIVYCSFVCASLITQHTTGPITAGPITPLLLDDLAKCPDSWQTLVAVTRSWHVSRCLSISLPYFFALPSNLFHHFTDVCLTAHQAPESALIPLATCTQIWLKLLLNIQQLCLTLLMMTLVIRDNVHQVGKYT